MPSSDISSLEKVVFLDVDGVLHPALGKEHFSVNCMEQLKRIVEQTGASIVLSSSRRVLSRGHSKVANALKQYGLALLDVTPDYGRIDKRAEEICAWLDLHPETQAFVAIDDMDLFLGVPDDCVQRLSGKFVRTSKKSGLSYQDADLAVDILQFRRIGITTHALEM
eukprot:Plantae.Rhodophyta-Purpureofilum_apyrenoidigerum.ctg5797.p1 GENE.Plantae.Rhodophyta-Purpureofilum_apyrenoidigerum.ctg5797~~Plantae.Rhodophyta-Purpureofilum_apyrenoidigerum.ctg5797.p1  ORF type:complete len:166 (+),score=34.81 Plantae.Rhodophyta-Purpureofilum_apyrenoidigerum.ctg5797:232-729(+)